MNPYDMVPIFVYGIFVCKNSIFVSIFFVYKSLMAYFRDPLFDLIACIDIYDGLILSD